MCGPASPTSAPSWRVPRSGAAFYRRRGRSRRAPQRQRSRMRRIQRRHLQQVRRTVPRRRLATQWPLIDSGARYAINKRNKKRTDATNKTPQNHVRSVVITFFVTLTLRRLCRAEVIARYGHNYISGAPQRSPAPQLRRESIRGVLTSSRSSILSALIQHAPASAAPQPPCRQSAAPAMMQRWRCPRVASAAASPQPQCRRQHSGAGQPHAHAQTPAGPPRATRRARAWPPAAARCRRRRRRMRRRLLLTPTSCSARTRGSPRERAWRQREAPRAPPAARCRR